MRVELKTTVFMKLDGQDQLVLSGSVIDVDGPNEIHPSCGTVLAEAPGVIPRINGKKVPTSVRGIRRR